MTKPTYERSCIICHKKFSYSHTLTLACSSECSDALRQMRRRQRYQRGKQVFCEEAAEISPVAWEGLRREHS
jgi:predicted nucleic acid-binding Zn ribbon protein